MQLSKSDYMLFLRHPAWLWLKKHDPKKLPAVSAELQAIFDAGNLFEDYAEQIFPDAVKLGFGVPGGYNQLTLRTKEALDQGAKTIFQAKFEADSLVCICDCLQVVEANTFDLFEIKSSAQVKVEHEWDLAFQKYVLEHSGYKIRNVAVVHANREYVRNGAIDARKLVSISDLTKQVEEKAVQTEINIKEALSVMNSDKCPDLTPALAGLNALGEWMEIYKTLVEIEENSIYSLCSLNASKVAELEKSAIKKLGDIPDDFPLTDKQRLQVLATNSDKAILDKHQIKAFLEKIKFPLYFLDYETFSSVIPAFDGVKPWEQVPFQYSLHRLDALNGKLQHFEYLHSENSSPAKAISQSLEENIGPEGTILAWNDSFEKSCNTRLGRLVPEFAEFFDSVNERIMDLMTPFSAGHYAHKDFCGSASIKKVLPVLVPELSYSDLDIHDGGTAQRVWMSVILDGKNSSEKEKILKNLLSYCQLDTLAMVEIYKHLQQIISS
jgi:hypothetical protein